VVENDQQTLICIITTGRSGTELQTRD